MTADTRLPCPSLSPWVCTSSCSWSQQCHPTVSLSVPHSPLPLNFSLHQGLSQWVSSSHLVAKVLGRDYKQEVTSVLVSWTEETDPLKLLYEVWYQDTQICLVVLETSPLCKFPASSTNRLLDWSGCLCFLSPCSLLLGASFRFHLRSSGGWEPTGSQL